MKTLISNINSVTRLLPRWVLREWLAMFLALGLCLTLALMLQAKLREEKQLQLSLQQLRQETLLSAGTQSVQSPVLQETLDKQSAGVGYLDSFPSEDLLKAILIDMSRLADTGALSASQATYRYVNKQPVPQLGQVEIVAPIQGSYTQVKRYVQTLLNRYPSLGLLDLSLQRSKVSDPNVIADLRWVFYYRLDTEVES